MAICKTLTLILLFPIFTLAQKPVDSLHSVNDLNDNRRFWYYFNNTQDKKVGLQDLLLSTDSLNIRIRSYSDILDISRRKDGTLTSKYYVFFIKQTKKLKPEKVVFNVANFDSTITKIMIDSFYRIGIDKLPDDSKISNYPVFVDGNSYRTQIATQNTYKEFTYSNPSSAEEIMEAAIFSRFIKFIYKMVNSKNQFEDLKKSLKSGQYKFSGFYVYKIK